MTEYFYAMGKEIIPSFGVKKKFFFLAAWWHVILVPNQGANSPSLLGNKES